MEQSEKHTHTPLAEHSALMGRWSFKYPGPKPVRALLIKTITLNCSQKMMGSQCNSHFHKHENMISKDKGYCQISYIHDKRTVTDLLTTQVFIYMLFLCFLYLTYTKKKIRIQMPLRCLRKHRAGWVAMARSFSAVWVLPLNPHFHG